MPRILWVDDKYIQRSSHEGTHHLRHEPHEVEIEHLRKGGITVVTVGSTAEAKSVIEAEGLSSFAGIISDMERCEGLETSPGTHMPWQTAEIAGLKLRRHVRKIEEQGERSSATPIFFYTTGRYVQERPPEVVNDSNCFITNSALTLYEHISRRLFRTPNILMRKDPGDPCSNLTVSRSHRFTDGAPVFFYRDTALQNKLSWFNPIKVVRSGWDDREKLLIEILRYPSALRDEYRIRLIEYAAQLSRMSDPWGGNKADTVATQVIRDYTSRSVYETVYGILNNRIFRYRGNNLAHGDILLATFILRHVIAGMYQYAERRSKNIKTSLHYDELVSAGNIYVTYRCIPVTSCDLTSLIQFVPFRNEYNRAFAMPIGPTSTTRNIEVATQFLESMSKTIEHGEHLIGVKFYIFDLPHQYLGLFEHYFPSRVAPAAAVDIRETSFYPEEEEVLLSGVFNEVVRHHPKSATKDFPRDIDQFDVVVINADRNHPSTFAMKGRRKIRSGNNYAAGEGELVYWNDMDDQARYFFGRLVIHWRSKICKAYHEIYTPDQKEVLSHYESQIQAREADLHKHFDEIIPSVQVPTTVFES